MTHLRLCEEKVYDMILISSYEPNRLPGLIEKKGMV